MKTKLIQFCFLLLLASPSFSQSLWKISGFVISKNSGETLQNVVLRDSKNNAFSTKTYSDGTFLLSMPEGSHTLIVEKQGFVAEQISIVLDKDTTFTITLRNKEEQNLKEVVVSSKSVRRKFDDVQIGAEKIEISELSKTPMLFGETDVIKSIQLLPGIKMESEGTSGYQVRGGTSAQNLVMLDGVSTYNAGHMMGIFSSFNDEALTNISLYKGLMPAQYGGATSSVLDISTKTGSMQKLKVSADLGLLSAKLNIEAPIIKNRLSFFVAARRSYLDMFLKMSKDYRDNVMNFYDLNAKLSYKIDSRNSVSLSFFKGKDNVGLKNLIDMDWGNTALVARLIHTYSDKLYGTTSLGYSNYGNDMGMEILQTKRTLSGFVRHLSFNEALEWTPSENHKLNAGLKINFIKLKSAEWVVRGYHQKEQRSALENNIWINDEWKPSALLGLSAGLRLSEFAVLGGSPYYKIDNEGNIVESLNYASTKVVKNYFILEPRFSGTYKISRYQKLKFGLSRNAQNIQAIRTSMSMPFDRYTMTSNIIKPQTSNQMSLGYMALTNNDKYELSIEAYYKNVENVYDYKDGKSSSSEIEIERLLKEGKGRSYGFELMARKNSGKLTGWIAYTLSWAENKIDGINNNKWYTASNDRRHDLSIVAMLSLSKRWELSSTWVFNTGQALTAPSAKYEVGGETYYYYAERNGYRAPNYHRLDLSLSYTRKYRKYTGQLVFGVYNLYNRYNPFIINFENDDTKPYGTSTVQYSLFGLIPSVSYNVKF